jgi:hypothetical protein
MPLTKGSGTDPAIFVIDLQDAYKKTIFFSFSAYYGTLKAHLNNFLRIKSQKQVTKQ